MWIRLSQKIASLWRYWNIIVYKTYANLKSEIEKTYLGCIWWVIEPLLNTAVFYVVFTQIMKVQSENFVIFLFTGMVAYGFFSTGLSMGANSIPANASILQQVYLPKITLVIIAVANVTWKYIFSLLALFPLLWLNGHGINWAYLALPFVLILQISAVVCLAMPLASLIPYFPDGITVLRTILAFGMWFSGVFYEAAQVPAHLRWIFYLNPAAVIIEAYRDILIHGHLPIPSHFIYFFPTIFIFGVIGMACLVWIDQRVTKCNLKSTPL